MSHSQRNAGLIFFAVVLIRLGFHFATGFVADDAYITFRYAQHIAAGEGFVYNIGQQVLGTPTPLFTLLVSIFVALRLGAVYGALLISIVAAGVTAALTYRFAERLRFGRLWVIPVLLYALWPWSLIAETSGLETALYTMLVVAAFYYNYSRRPYYALAAATLAVVTLPEGAIVLVLIVAASLIRYPQRWLSFLAVPAIVLVPWLLFADWYFGSPIPHTLVARVALIGEAAGAERFELLHSFFAPGGTWSWFLPVAAIPGIIWLWRSQRFGVVEGLWFLGTLAVYWYAPPEAILRYTAPLYPLYLLVASGALVWLFDRVDWLHERKGNLIPLIWLALFAGLGIADGRVVMSYRAEQKGLDYTQEAMALYIRTHSSAKDRVAAEEIGYIGHFSERPILDRTGLVSPEAVPYNLSGEHDRLIYDYQPEFVVVLSGSPMNGFVTDSTFTSNYELLRSFQHAPSDEYLLYHRRNVSQAVTP